jgi:putative GTP pyrophosphokinase
MLTNSRIDALGKKLRDSQIDAGCLTELEHFRELFVPAYRFVEDVLADKMGLPVTGRPSKSTVAIVDKLNRESVRLSQMQDIAGCRVLVACLFEQDRVVADMQVFLGDAVVDDKRELPTNGYRAVHLISRGHGRPVEIQVRTRLQHAWAELSEKIADRFGHDIKYGKGDQAAINFLEMLSSVTQRIEVVEEKRRVNSEIKRAHGKSKELITILKKLSNEERMLFRELNSIFSGKRTKSEAP